MRRKHLIFSLVFLVLLCSFVPSIASSQTLQELDVAMKNAWDKLYNPSSGAWASYMWSHTYLEKMITEIRAEIKALGGIQLTPSLHPATQGADAVSKIGTAVKLSDQIKDRLVKIEQQREITERLWVGDKYWIGVERAWFAYEHAVHAYNEKSSKKVEATAPIKQPVTELYFCYGPCDELFETASLAQVSHQVYCSEKHGTSGTTGVTYYICSDSGTCDRSAQHWKECRASNCSVIFPPAEHEHELDYYDHKIKCEESVYGPVNGGTCGEEYFTCVHQTCPESNTHLGNARPQPCGHPYDPNSSEAYNHRYVKYQCGRHSGYKCKESSDHKTWISSCTQTDTNGNTCNNSSGYWECSQHTHTYPSAAPEPTLVECSHGSCSEQVSSGTTHRATCGSLLHYFWPGCPDKSTKWWHQYTTHAEKTCRYKSCGNTWRRCLSKTPNCSDPKRSGKKCWAI